MKTTSYIYQCITYAAKNVQIGLNARNRLYLKYTHLSVRFNAAAAFHTKTETPDWSTHPTHSPSKITHSILPPSSELTTTSPEQSVKQATCARSSLTLVTVYGFKRSSRVLQRTKRVFSPSSSFPPQLHPLCYFNLSFFTLIYTPSCPLFLIPDHYVPYWALGKKKKRRELLHQVTGHQGKL